MKSNARDPEQAPALLPESAMPAVFLILFCAVAVLVLAALLADPQRSPAVHNQPERSFSPEDFPEIDFNPPLLPEVTPSPGNGARKTFMVPPPPFSDEDNFPCTECHDEQQVDTQPYELDYHEEIELTHGSSDRWCFDCHNPENRDVLRLINGRTVEFSESHRLCGQCHGTIYRDWKAGIHGRRRGYWNGSKSYLLCAHCHNPHSPRPALIVPLPPPVHPSFLAADSGETRE